MKIEKKIVLLVLCLLLCILLAGIVGLSSQTDIGISDILLPVNDSTTIILAGDMMFDRYIRKRANLSTYEGIIDDFTGLFREADLVIANLEGPITSYDSLHTTISQQDPHHYTFTFDPVVARVLSQANIKLVSLGNNHILNFGKEGATETVEFLDAQNVGYFGLPQSSQSTILEIDHQTFAFVAFNEFDSHNVNETMSLIGTLNNEADTVIVFAHWGDEYAAFPNESQITAAHAFVDSGADLVVGAHPHVIQSKETYRNVPIYYSLGNFVFDQYFSPEVRCGLVLEISYKNGKIQSVTEHGSYLREDGTTQRSKCSNSYI